MSDFRTEIVNYISSRFAQEDEVLNELLLDQKSGGGPMMNIGPDQGKFLYLITVLLKPQRILELGSYYGYSAIWMARGLEKLGTGKLHCVEVSDKQCQVIKKHIEKAGLVDFTDVHHGSGIDMMKKFIKENQSFDVIFVDADKANYVNYLDLAYDLLPVGGLLLVDNCLWDAKVLDSDVDTITKNIQAFNDKLAADKRFESSILTIQDGLSFSVKLA